jgi:hypothetical protein
MHASREREKPRLRDLGLRQTCYDGFGSRDIFETQRNAREDRFARSRKVTPACEMVLFDSAVSSLTERFGLCRRSRIHFLQCLKHDRSADFSQREHERRPNPSDFLSLQGKSQSGNCFFAGYTS